MNKFKCVYSELQLKNIFDSSLKEILEIHRRVILNDNIKENEISNFHNNIKTFEDLVNHIKWLDEEFHEHYKK